MPEFRVDVSQEAHIVQVAICQAASFIEASMTAPHVLMRPTISLDGNQWCALYGADLMSGVVGFGDTPEEACADFDRVWREKRAPEPKP